MCAVISRSILLVGLVLATAFETGAQQSVQVQLNRLAAAQRKTDSLLAQLASRIKDLETESEEGGTDPQEEAEKEESAKDIASLEKRIAALERAGSAENRNAAPAARTVRAPFVVEDEDGSVVLRVTGGKTPRLMIGEDKGGQVELGTGSAGGGVVRVRDASNTDRVILIASDDVGQVRTMSRTHSAVLTSSDEGAIMSLFFGDTPAARMRAGKTGFGAMVLTNPAGIEIVGAGSLNGVGTVSTGPRQRPAGLVMPSEIRGVR